MKLMRFRFVPLTILAIVSLSLAATSGCRPRTSSSADSAKSTDDHLVALESDSGPSRFAEAAARPQGTDVRVEGGMGQPVLEQATPRLVVDEAHFHFGHMDPLTLGEHPFRVRNVGSGPLVFRTPRSTCKCTIGEIPAEPIPPGGEGAILVRWQTEQNKTHFHESATVETNDPANPELVLTVEGTVLVHVTAVPPEIVLPGVRPDEPTVATTIIASQVWEHFTVDGWESSLQGVEFELVPASPDELTKLEARNGYRLRVTLPNDLPQGDFQHWIRFRVDPQRPDVAPKQYEIPLTGRVLRRLAVYGTGIDHMGRVRLGIVPSKTGRQHRFVVKVRDPLPEIVLREVVAEPAFVTASLRAASELETATGLYHLEISIPPNTAPCRYQGERAGRLHLRFDHPRIPDLTLRVDFAVADHAYAQTRGASLGE